MLKNVLIGGPWIRQDERVEGGNTIKGQKIRREVASTGGWKGSEKLVVEEIVRRKHCVRCVVDV